MRRRAVSFSLCWLDREEEEEEEDEEEEGDEEEEEAATAVIFFHVYQQGTFLGSETQAGVNCPHGLHQQASDRTGPSRSVVGLRRSRQRAKTAVFLEDIT